ncbi:hypothetical protein FCV25MIE_15656 [Fagus crenata]
MAASNEKVKEDGDFLCHPALSIFSTLKLQISIGFLEVEIECNNWQLVSLLHYGRDYFSDTAWILDDIKELETSFSSISFKCVPSLCNRAITASFSKER